MYCTCGNSTHNMAEKLTIIFFMHYLAPWNNECSRFRGQIIIKNTFESFISKPKFKLHSVDTFIQKKLLKQFFVKSWIKDTLQRKMRYHKDKSVVNVNALVVTGKAIYAWPCYKVICHFTFAVEIPWCYHPNETSLIELSKGTIHFLKLKKKKIPRFWKCDFLH